MKWEKQYRERTTNPMQTLNINILEKINSPQDVKKLSVSEMENLATEIRNTIINKVNLIGGTLGP